MRGDAPQATEAFSLTYNFIKSLLTNDRSPVESEWLMQVNIAHLLHEHGNNAPQKQLYAPACYTTVLKL